jgi:hypothetical protein
MTALQPTARGEERDGLSLLELAARDGYAMNLQNSTWGLFHARNSVKYACYICQRWGAAVLASGARPTRAAAYGPMPNLKRICESTS